MPEHDHFMIIRLTTPVPLSLPKTNIGFNTRNNELMFITILLLVP